MRRTVIISILFAISLTGLSQNNHVPCSNFKKGHFSYRTLEQT